MTEQRHEEIMELIKNAKERLNENSLAWLYDEYAVRESEHRVTTHQHQWHVGVGFNLYSRMLKAGAPENELRSAALYLLGALDCDRHSLSIRRLSDDLGIIALREKYPPQKTRN